MGKTAKAEKDSVKAGKATKTLRGKLRKKREELKVHERQQRGVLQKQFIAEYSKGQLNSSSFLDSLGVKIKEKKVRKYINKFVNIYEDDLEQFYDMFKTFDQKGFIDIAGLEDRALKKCLKKLFKHLPLQKEKTGYLKVEQMTGSLQSYIRGMVAISIEYYLEHSSNPSEGNQQSSQEEDQQPRKNKNNQKEDNIQLDQQIPLESLAAVTESGPSLMGPYMPEGERQKMARQFEEQLQEMKKNKELIAKQEEDEFNQIFMGKTRKQIKSVTPDSNQSVPEHLMAKGSALIGQKVQIDQQQIEEYNKINRPKKLIQMHKQLMQERGAEQPNTRKPFSRQRDILGEGTKSYMSNSTFFDFKNRMSKPKSTNQFL